jgi:pescadillo protein
MLTFLEFYHAMLGFVNYKLYSDANYRYPPLLDAKLEEHGAGLFMSYKMVSATEKESSDQTTTAPTITSKKKKVGITESCLIISHQLLGTETGCHAQGE